MQYSFLLFKWNANVTKIEIILDKLVEHSFESAEL